MKKMRKVLSLLLALVMLLSLAACGSSSSSSDASDTSGSDVEEESNSEYKVAMITDSGDITDQSFNQTTYEACVAFCEENNVEFTYKKPDSDTDDARIAMIDSAVGEGYNVIVMPGYLFAAALVECSTKYPDVKFVALDMSESDILSAALGDEYDENPDADWDVSEYYNTENTYCAVYQEELPGYMAGYAAVMMGYTQLGFLGGMEVPAVIRYGYGYLQGINDAAEELGITDEISVEYAYGGQFYGSSEITAVMDTWYSSGTEVVFACGGGIYTSAAEAAAKVDGKVIGVDVDQAATIDEYGEGMTITSAMKGLAATTETLLSAIILEDTWDDYVGKIDNLGLVSTDDMSLNYVQLAESTQWCDTFTEEDYAELVAALYNGDITVDNSVDSQPELSISVDYRDGTIM